MVIIKCPACNSGRLLLTELWKNHFIDLNYENGKIECLWMGPGDPYKVTAVCKDCKHVFDTGLTYVDR